MTQAGKAVIDQQEGTEVEASGDDHCLPLLSSPINEDCKLPVLLVYFAHINLTNHSYSLLSKRKQVLTWLYIMWEIE